MTITNKQELAYVMDFYKIKEFPIYDGKGRPCGKIIRTKNGVEYERGHLYYYEEYIAFQVAYRQVNDAVEVIKLMNTKTRAVVVYSRDEMTWEYADKEGDPVTHHVYPRTINHKKEFEWEGTYDELFEKMEEENCRLRYCNGCDYSFKDERMNRLRRVWYGIIPEGRKFDLYYGGGVVD